MIKKIWNDPKLLLLVFFFVCGSGWLWMIGFVRTWAIICYSLLQISIILRLQTLIMKKESP